MKEIKFKIDYYQLTLLDGLVESSLLTEMSGLSMEQLASMSVLNGVYELFKRKLISKRRANKNFSISLEYHEAYFLYKVLKAYVNGFESTSYERNVLLQLIADFDQKLKI